MLGVKRVVRRFGSLFLSGAFASYRLMWSFFYNMPLVERVKSSYRGGKSRERRDSELEA